MITFAITICNWTFSLLTIRSYGFDFISFYPAYDDGSTYSLFSYIKTEECVCINYLFFKEYIKYKTGYEA